MKIFKLLLIFLFILNLTISLKADSELPAINFEKISQLKIGEIINLKKLNLEINYLEKIKEKNPEIYYLEIPQDLDIKNTELPPYSSLFPYLHLNLPFEDDKSPTQYLIISDQPESIDENNYYLGIDKTGANGIYAQSFIPAQKRIRMLIDHQNLTDKNKEIRIYLTSFEEDNTIYIHKKGWKAASNSLVSGSLAEQISRETILADKRSLSPNLPLLLEKWDALKPKETLVSWYEFTCSKDTLLQTIVVDEGELINPNFEILKNLPKLKSLRWRDKEEKLKKLVNKIEFPSRYNRVLNNFIHARGIFHNPDKAAYSTYDYQKNPYWVQVYSSFEYIEGKDELTENDIPVDTNNRGNYGAYIRTHIDIKSLPVNINKIAILAVCTADKLGGLFHTAINRTSGELLVFAKPDNDFPYNLITLNNAALIWRGKIAKGDFVDINFFSLANTSVRIFYLIIPIL
ncbi:MAG: hypothetical protein HYU63_03580 [Armatimonadetes bacterium]|nr:hypothetical protein [Armatimonadota bacterium]